MSPSRSRQLKTGLLTLGLSLRFVWVFFRGLSRDDITSLSYIVTPEWASVMWDNAPPTFYVLMKAFYLLGQNEWVLRAGAFAISSVSFIVLFRFLDREEKGNTWLLAFWALYPTSVINATIRPTVLVELAGIFFFLAIRSRSLGKIAGGIALLVGTTYLAAIAPLVALADEDLKDKKKIALLGGGVLVALVGLLQIRWHSLTWIKTADFLALGESGLLMLSQLWGFSLPLFIAVAWTLLRHRQMPRSIVVIILMCLIGPFVTGHKFASSRFLISLTPWVLMSIALTLRIRREWIAGALVAVIPAITTFWFLLHEKSGWDEAGRYVAATGEKAIVYAPRTMAAYYSANFVSGELDMDQAIAKNISGGGWILRANPDRDVRMKAFVPEGGHRGFEISERKIFGEKSLEPVQAVRIVPAR